MAYLFPAALFLWAIAVLTKIGKSFVKREDSKTETDTLIKLNVENALLKARVAQLEKELSEERSRVEH